MRSTLLCGSQILPPSRKQPLLLFDVHVSIHAFKHEAGGDLGEFFGLDFVEASAVDAAFRNQFGGHSPFVRWGGRGEWVAVSGLLTVGLSHARSPGGNCPSTTGK